MNDCIFCSIIKNERKEKIFVVFETEKTLAILDLFPVSDGHVLLITKNHVSDVTELDNESWLDILSLLKLVIFKIKKGLNVTNFNIINNIGRLAEQSVFHFHIHVIPKYEKDVGFSWKVNRKSRINDLESIIEKLKKVNFISNGG